ncbi:MAG: DUF3293 domain-containing protein [Acidimicrobiales bacterium]
MTDLWEAFAGAVVRISLPDGDHRIEPRSPGRTGDHPFGSPIHIITAYNPGGIEADVATNEARHAALAEALGARETFATVGSAPDGSMAEPGLAVIGLEADEAVELGRRFGQEAIYRWTADALTIVGVRVPDTVEMGWSLVRL